MQWHAIPCAQVTLLLESHELRARVGIGRLRASVLSRHRIGALVALRQLASPAFSP